jgi:hypothetical protein
LWHYIDNHFQQFLDELELLPSEMQDAEGKAFRNSCELYHTRIAIPWRRQECR